ncbi:MAG: hypothetical protein QF371_08295, partial [Flavobacteriales bacterium]|nr:hypothetical protein [Flavobacteriales bacterium]
MRGLGHTLLSVLVFVQISVGQQLDVISPNDFIAGKTYPMVMEAESNNSIDLFYSEELSLNVAGGTLENGIIKIKKGRGMASIASATNNSLTVSGQGV